MSYYFTLFLISNLIFLSSNSTAQNTFFIRGKVMSHGIEVPGASVLLSGFKATAITSNEGDFVIGNLQPGKYDLVIKMLGYNPTSQTVEIINKDAEIIINIQESSTTLNEVVISKPKYDNNRDFNMKIFIDHFIGRTENAKLCKILNPDVISFYFDEESKILYGSASDLIIIENKALGYKINFLLKGFEANFKTSTVFYAGLPHFEAIKARPAQLSQYSKNRKNAYLGSMNHFYKSIFNGNSLEEGFVILKRKDILNSERQPDSLIDSKIKEYSNHAFSNVKSSVFKVKDSLNYWNKQKSRSKYLNQIDTNLIDIDTLISIQNIDLKELKFKDDLVVIYEKGKESGLFNLYKLKIDRPQKYEKAQVSVVKMLLDNIRFYSNGLLHDPRSVLYDGYWAFKKIADAVPIDEEFN